MSDQDKLCAAMSIIQQHILALDTNVDPKDMFGSQHMPGPSLELALSLMSDALEGLEVERQVG